MRHLCQAADVVKEAADRHKPSVNPLGATSAMTDWQKAMTA
jgi:hypothetical protein